MLIPTLLLAYDLIVTVARFVFNINLRNCVHRLTFQDELPKSIEEEDIQEENIQDVINKKSETEEVDAIRQIIMQTEKTPEKPTDPNKWIEVGLVESILIYPLAFGRGQDIDYCYILRDGMVTVKEDRMIWDNMFAVFHEETNNIMDCWSNLFKIIMNIVSDKMICLQAENMPELFIDLEKLEESEEYNTFMTCIKLHLNTAYQIKCYDCGREAAEWISRCLTPSNSGLRLGRLVGRPEKIKKLSIPFYDRILDKKMNLDLFFKPECKRIMRLQSLFEISEQTAIPMVEIMLEISPHILISSSAFEREHWKWIKIGETVFKNNDSLIRFYEGINPMEIPIEVRIKMAGFNVNVEEVGYISVRNKVYVYIP